ncbi:hypothetical protein CDL15_Pgr001006 [Punica granatum]|uniref:Uncharacterized protein n=1 Tax=Punica granatum TaxID=22663 RepID=A0A218XIL8_PUNGR|nr:hypothetical protein CDL15_Pgr001006 [Punica granatum]
MVYGVTWQRWSKKSKATATFSRSSTIGKLSDWWGYIPFAALTRGELSLLSVRGMVAEEGWKGLFEVFRLQDAICGLRDDGYWLLCIAVSAINSYGFAMNEAGSEVGLIGLC